MEIEPNVMTERYFASLEEQIDELIRRYESLIQEKQVLQEQHNALLDERDTLIQQNEQSRSRIDAMVARLKGLEQSS